MKSIAPAAMAAIEAGEAIVTGAVEIGAVSSSSSLQFDTNMWRYKLEAYNSSNTYEAVGYDDSAWSTGLLPFGSEPWSFVSDEGFRDTPVNSYATQQSLHLRRTMFLGAAIDSYELEAFVDNGWTVWINGVQVFTEYDAFGHADSQTIDGSYFEVGANTIYIKVVDDAANTLGVDHAYFDLKYRVVGSGSGGSGEGIRVWGGYGPTEIDGEVYQGIGDRGLAQQTAGAIGGIAQGLMLSLSGIEPAVLELLDGSELKGASVVLRRLIFASDGKTLLDAHVFDRGRVDTIESDEVIGAGAAIKLAVESAARGLGKSGARQRSDSDQRLINSSDGYMKHVAYAGEKMLYWGGKRPKQAGTSL